MVIHGDILCFLMAVEIERLIVENDRLKYKIKNTEDK
jgi:hypothetical protein